MSETNSAVSQVADPADPGVVVHLRKPPVVTASAVGTAPPRTPSASDTVTVTIDGRQVQAKAGEWIIDAADQAGVYIPRFCYHPRMKPVGMCRMCLVEVEGPRGSTLMPACFNPVSDGMTLHTRSPKALKAQEGVLEFLLVNHPLDCPVCDKGGECPLQDQTLTYGPGETRFVEEKRHWDKPIAISELVYLDRERCIQCGRCVRFADEVAGDALIDFAERGDRTEVAVFPDSPYSSYFSGNVVQICPVGALTSKPYRFKARPWDLEQVETTCTSCAVGCRTVVQATQGQVTRLIGVDSDPVNWGWLCDKGRFSYPDASDAGRVSVPMIREGDELVESTWAEAIAKAASGISAALRFGGGSSVGVIGGARLTNEDAYVWSKLARVVLGTDNIDAQLGDGLPAQTVLGLPRATIDQAAAAPLVITVGSDVKDELPVLYIRLRHAVLEGATQLVELNTTPTGLSPYAADTARYKPGELAALAVAITSKSEPTGPVGGVDASTIASIRGHISRAGREAGPSGPSVVVLIARPSLAENDEQVATAARILAEIPGVAFLSGLRRGNIHGALDMGMAPGILPGRVALDAARSYYEHHWAAELPAEAGLDTSGMLVDAARGHIGALVLLGSDPLVDFPDADRALRGLVGARFVVAVDTHLNESVRRADVVLPAAPWSQRRGTFTNLEGRVSWLGQVTSPGSAWPEWMIAVELAARLGVDLGYESPEGIWAEIEKVSPLHRGVTREVLSGPYGGDGVVVPVWASGHSTAAVRPLDPMADPGISSAERHKVAASSLSYGRAGAGSSSATKPAQPQTAQAPASDGGPDAQVEPATPPFVGLLPVPVPSPSKPAGSAVDGALTLVTRRKMWDGGTAVQSSTYLSGLAPPPVLVANPAELAALGVAEGEKVTVSSAKGSLTVAASADAGVARGIAVLAWNLPGGRVGELIDAGGRLNFVSVEPGGDK
ncbi:MAG: NADH-quinone oxidoreductase subunit NuoG [Acidimicrobiales bacterium]